MTRDDDELGFIGASVAGVAAAGKLAKGLVKKKKKKAAAKAPPTDKADNAKAAGIIKKAGKKAGPDISAIVREVVSHVPAAVRAQVLDAIKELQGQKAKTGANINNMAGKVNATFKPQITAMLATLKAQQTARQATYEHERLVEQEKFRSGTRASLAAISSRLDAIEIGQNQVVAALRLPGVAIVRRKLPIFGPKNVLEG